ncbi:NAD-dependent epimerase/dehydratase family protein [Flavobacteriaceae sp. LMIT009]
MILVTGGTGLVGSHLLYQLTKTEPKVKALFRNKDKIASVKHVFSYYTNNVEDQFAKINWVEGDITDIPSLNNAFKNVSKVYHCAAFISFDVRDYHKLRQVNIEGTANVVNTCLAHNVDKLCYVSSIAATGKPENNSPITESTTWNPEASHSVYAITKYGGEMEVWRGTQEGLNAIIVNPGVIIGPGYWKSGSGSLIRFVYKGVKRYTEGVGGYVDIFDVVNPMIKLMGSSTNNERFILVSKNISYKEFFTKIANHLDVNPPSKNTSKTLLAVAWRLDWLRAHFRGKRRRLTKHTAKSLITKSIYSNKKVIDTLDYSFKSIDDSITEVCQLFLKDVKA